jgi:DNA-binding transcriptional LysR family regulator
LTDVFCRCASLCSAKSIPLAKLAAEPLVGLSRKDYPESYRFIERLFRSISAKPRIAVECDSASSLIMEVESGGIALSTTVFERVAGNHLCAREEDCAGTSL